MSRKLKGRQVGEHELAVDEVSSDTDEAVPYVSIVCVPRRYRVAVDLYGGPDKLLPRSGQRGLDDGVEAREDICPYFIAPRDRE